jgi:dolichol-phosphate mannosyltransferase
MLFSLVFSFRNEEANLAELVQRVDSTMRSVPDAGYELVFVNDDSTDRSLEILGQLRE